MEHPLLVFVYVKYYLSSISIDMPNFLAKLSNTDSENDMSNGLKKGLLRITASISWYLGPVAAYKLAIRPPIY